MTVNCHPQPLLQVYFEPINHLSDFKYSKMSSAASDFKRRKALAWVHFGSLNVFGEVRNYPSIIQLILHHLRDHAPL